eukprot:TRINITY_DN95_c0_g3_i2.p1 TRINITY_DN95_c0_g3~~TRINITY_DN95_c0_g3_i2.p1  ORF type:complete len:117 (+),score=25.89 TRINITY_DN95_c0_g3_i2:72-422(+)
MSNLKITYFNAEGRAEPIRLALFIGGIEFDDERIDFPELQKRKPNLPFGSLPVLTTGEGEIIAQSNAVLRYAGRLAKLYPQDNLQATRGNYKLFQNILLLLKIKKFFVILVTFKNI